MMAFGSGVRVRRWAGAIAVAAAVGLAACSGGAPASPPASSPASSPPTAAGASAPPRLFAPGRVSTAAPEFATSFAPDGGTVYFNVASADRKVLRIVHAAREGGQWSAARPVSFSSGAYRDVDPFVTADGGRLYFSSDRSIGGDAPKADFGTWYVERRGDGWGEPIHAGPALDTAASEAFVSVTRSGTVYFGSDAAGEGRRDIYRAPMVDGEHGPPERIALRLATAEAGDAELQAGNPCIDPDERFLIFVADGSPGNPDLFISWRREGRFGPARNLGPRVNSEQADFAPALGPDGLTLFFTSERPGMVAAGAVPGRPPGDIYRVDLPPLLAAE